MRGPLHWWRSSLMGRLPVEYKIKAPTEVGALNHTERPYIRQDQRSIQSH